MSTCPEKDIHSLYIDKELPPSYEKEYLEHLENCPKCKAIYERLNALHQNMKNDSQEIRRKFTPEELEKSYERLQSRLSFSKVLQFQEKPSIRKSFLSSLKYIATGVAAAAVAAIIIPSRLTVKKDIGSQSSVPVATSSYSYRPAESMPRQVSYGRSPVQGLQPTAVRYSRNMPSADLSTFFQDDRTPMPQAQMISEFSSPVMDSVHASGTFTEGMLPPLPQSPMHPRMEGYPREFPAGSHRPGKMHYQYPAVNDSLFPVDDYGAIPVENPQDEKSTGFSLNLSSPLGNIYLKIGSGK